MDTLRSIFMLHVLPDLIGGKREDGGHKSHEDFKDLVHSGLSGFSGDGFGWGHIKPVFNDVQIKRGKIKDTEVMEAMVHGVKLEIVIGIEDFCAHHL
jgi:hypothetical protein